MEQKPSIGRIVHYFPVHDDPSCHKNGTVELVAASITRIHDIETGRVNLTVWPDNALPEPRLDVPHKSDPTLVDNMPYWDWTVKV